MVTYRRLTIFLPEEKIKMFKKLAIDAGMPVSRYIEELLEKVSAQSEE